MDFTLAKRNHDMKTPILIPLLFLLGCASTPTGTTEPSFSETFAYGLLEDATAVAVVEIVAKNPETRDGFITAERDLSAAIESGTISAATLEKAFRAVDISKLSQEGRIGYTLARAQFRRYGQRIGINQSEHFSKGLIAMRNGIAGGLGNP